MTGGHSPPTLQVNLDQGVKTITIANPRYRNAFTPELMGQLVAEIQRADSDPAVKVLIITGEGTAFSSGGYVPTLVSAPAVQEADPTGPLTPEGLRARLSAQHWRSPMASTALRALQKPSIAVINGVCAGAAMDLALGCDLRIAAASARFITMFYERALFPLSSITYLLLRLVGPAKTYELMYLSEPIGAEEAERIGLVNRVVPDEALGDVVQGWARRLAAGPSVMLGLVKYVVTRTQDLPWEAALELASTAYYLTRQTRDHQEAVQAFLERRPPSFQGR